ncbi:probable leucine-rich repeat receptor-like protein kinase At5g63930 [Punica granatum]|uniref:Probable leucine-rich repeat receptor-like protein kinase At5g63930 n=1 Tax=Punica granatum TaxID=22663 RepID=A0A218WNT6_PUNGR|nr:probable leucine-rich repeat receptor-like protein kinase At5g63930 [Punica granatum]OWM73901.1 hypothetical protein CDL15_Pgr018961 [Punica granatum]
MSVLRQLYLFCFFFFLLFPAHALSAAPTSELRALMDLKASLDPDNTLLPSWNLNGDPCNAGGGSFDGVGCTADGHVANISLQGRGLSGKLSPAIAGLEHLTGLYLHYNSLYGEIPREIGNLSRLSDLYLNMNNLSGEIPSEIGNLESLQVLQLSYNQFTGSIPTQLGSLSKLGVFSVQSNQLTGAIPASLGDLASLTRLDLSFNRLFGSIPTRLAGLPLLEVLDIHNNTLSGNVPPSLKRLNDGFLYENNLDLCGAGYLTLTACNASYSLGSSRPEPYASGTTGPLTSIPETANVQLPCNHTQCSNLPRSRHSSVIIGIVVATIALSAIGAFSFTQYRRRKQKLGISFDHSDSRLSTDQSGGPGYRKNGSPLASLEYSNGWDPLADGKVISGLFPQEVMQSFRFNLEEVESATQYFSEVNVLGKSNSSTTYKGILRDGSLVSVKCINKTSCKSDESEFLKGLNVLTSLRHENLVRLRGFCCSRGRGECFLIYDYVPNGSLLRYLDLKDGDGNILEWSTRVSIVKGIAKGIAYLHSFKAGKPALLHQNISADKVLIDQRYSPLLSGCSLHRLLTNDTIFSSLKEAAAMGYLAPEYASTGRFTEKSDIYAFGMLLFQIMSGKQKVTSSIRLVAEGNRFQELVDRNLHGRFFEYEAAKIARIALLCTHESPMERPSMDAIIHELGNCSSCL